MKRIILFFIVLINFTVILSQKVEGDKYKSIVNLSVRNNNDDLVKIESGSIFTLEKIQENGKLKFEELLFSQKSEYFEFYKKTTVTISQKPHKATKQQTLWINNLRNIDNKIDRLRGNPISEIILASGIMTVALTTAEIKKYSRASDDVLVRDFDKIKDLYKIRDYGWITGGVGFGLYILKRSKLFTLKNRKEDIELNISYNSLKIIF